MLPGMGQCGAEERKAQLPMELGIDLGHKGKVELKYYSVLVFLKKNGQFPAHANGPKLRNVADKGKGN